MGKDRLRVSSSVRDGNTVISQMNTSLNGVTSKLIHENMANKDIDYMCNVSIMDGSTTLDFISISCGTSSKLFSNNYFINNLFIIIF